MSEANFSALLKGAQGEYEEKKSRFLSQSFCVRREEEVAEILAGLRKQHYDARHVCYAYILHGNPPVEKSSDDGEPAKTAGLPMLDLLRAASLRNTLITVVRYFGGTKLGTGGLVRQGSAACLDRSRGLSCGTALSKPGLRSLREGSPPCGGLLRDGALPAISGGSLLNAPLSTGGQRALSHGAHRTLRRICYPGENGNALCRGSGGQTLCPVLINRIRRFPPNIPSLKRCKRRQALYINGLKRFYAFKKREA